MIIWNKILKINDLINKDIDTKKKDEGIYKLHESKDRRG